MPSRIVVKFGTSVLTGGTQRLNRAHMLELVRQCAALHNEGHQLIICTSGAIAAGRERLAYPTAPETLNVKQMLAAVGQSRLMERWEQLFEIYGIHVGQMLLTRSDIENRHRFLNARDTLQTLLEHRIIPIVNENDAVATAEIKVGDNDNLSALCALLAGADLLILLTDQAGLYTADPRRNPDAQLISEIGDIDAELKRLASGSASGLGVGGMKTKLEAADVARRAGADVVIAAGNAPDIIRRIIAGEKVGTRFASTETPLENRKRWIFGSTVPSGRIMIDAGASNALRRGGNSLLPAGTIGVEGEFDRGDVVNIIGPDSRNLARGIVRYSSADVRRIKGCHSDQIPQILGFGYGPVVVHRDDLILL